MSAATRSPLSTVIRCALLTPLLLAVANFHPLEYFLELDAEAVVLVLLGGLRELKQNTSRGGVPHVPRRLARPHKRPSEPAAHPRRYNPPLVSAPQYESGDRRSHFAECVMGDPSWLRSHDRAGPVHCRRARCRTALRHRSPCRYANTDLAAGNGLAFDFSDERPLLCRCRSSYRISTSPVTDGWSDYASQNDHNS
jgi:hypothetical protein